MLSKNVFSLRQPLKNKYIQTRGNKVMSLHTYFKNMLLFQNLLLLLSLT